MDELIDHYYKIRASIGINKSSDIYVAFPTDSYSKAQENRGVHQHGMPRQVKEEI